MLWVWVSYTTIRFRFINTSCQEKPCRPLESSAQIHQVRVKYGCVDIANLGSIDDPNCSATLIVAPLSLLQQWKQEILDMTEEGSLKVLIYHGANRPKQVKDVREYDVVLTTYQVRDTYEASL